ncbi:MAG: SelB C-terminal domain-containing protein, partial [Planctomycetes bacterium]|nr:SelB C-terminal domain-containing protein [Planctomycetota bacterium]
RAGHSTALNLPDIPIDSAERGDVVGVPDRLEAVDRLEIELRAVHDIGALRHGESVHLHLGTTETTARVFLLDQKDLPAGQTGLGQLVCDDHVVCLPGDFALLRRLSPARTIAGGRVLGLGGRRLRRFRDEVVDRLQEKERSLEDPQKRLGVALREAGAVGLSFEDARRRLGCTDREFEGMLAPVLERGDAYRAAKSERLFAPASVHREEERIARKLAEYYESHSMAATCPIAELRIGSSNEALLTVGLERLATTGAVEVLPGGMVQDPSRVERISPEERRLLDALSRWLDEAGQRPHTRQEFAQRWGRDGATHLERLLEDRGAHAVGQDFLWGPKSFETALRHVTEVCGANDGVLVIPELRDRLETSRKFLIPFLEHLDRVGITARKGDRRILRRR